MRAGAAATLVLAFSAAAGWLAWNTLIGPPAVPRYVVAFEGTGLSSPDREAKNLYLRRAVYLAQRPRHAWLQVIARDRLRVYVNGEVLGGGDSDGLPVATVLDLVPHLKPGTNVIAITARQSSIGVPPVVAIEGAYALSAGQTARIEPDPQWRSSTTFEHGWLSDTFQDRQWMSPAMAPLSIRAAVRTPPRAVTVESQAAWMTPDQSEAGRVAARREFTLTGRPVSGWLRLASTGGYRLSINGVLVDEREGDIGTDQTPRHVSRIYDVTTYLRRGSNVVAVLLTRATAPPRVLADLEVEDWRGGRVRVSSDERWVSLSNPPADALDRTVESAGWHACRIEIGDVGLPPWTRQTVFVTSGPRPPIVLQRLLGLTALVLLIAAVTLIACRAVESRLGAVASLATVPAAVALGAIVLLGHDPRIRLSVAAQVWCLALAALSIPIQWLLLWRLPAVCRPAARIRLPHARRSVIVLALIAVGLWFRLAAIRTEPPQWDEVEHYEYTLGFLERGFPSRQIHPDLPIAYVHTSELMFVPSAIVALFADDPRLVMRLPAVVWSALSIWLVYVMGRRMFAPTVGVIAAALMTFSPVAIAMATVGRYFAQLQFFTLLAVYALWLALRPDGRVNRKALAVTAAAFAAMYLTWEGSAFVAVGMAFAALLQGRERLRTVLLDPAVWAAIVVVGMVMLAQYSHTALQQTQFLWYGTSLSDLRIRPMWNYSTFAPWFYVWASSWSLDALLPMLGLVGALLLSARHSWRRPLQFVLVTYFTTCLFMATLLPAVAWRYVHHLVPLLALLASASLAAATAGIIRMARRTPRPSFAHPYARAVATLVIVTGIASGSGLGLDLRDMTGFRVEGFHPSIYKFPDLGGPSRYVRDRMQPGDVVLATDPFQVKQLMGVHDGATDEQFYWPASTLQLPATLDDKRPIALDRRDGTPAITDLAAMRDLFARHERIWYIVQPERHENQNVPEVSAFLRQQMDVVYEDFEAVVLLRDRNHRPSGIRFEEEQQLGFGRRHRSNFPPEPPLPGS
jgi:Dolichyl-phosphate-mannose-protein mannosyltransferase